MNIPLWFFVWWLVGFLTVLLGAIELGSEIRVRHVIDFIMMGFLGPLVTMLFIFFWWIGFSQKCKLFEIVLWKGRREVDP